MPYSLAFLFHPSWSLDLFSSPHFSLLFFFCLSFHDNSDTIVFAVIVGGKLASSIPLENWVRNCAEFPFRGRGGGSTDGQEKLEKKRKNYDRVYYSEKGDEILPFIMFRAQSIFTVPASDFLKLIFFLLHFFSFLFDNHPANGMKSVSRQQWWRILYLFFVVSTLSDINFREVLTAY